jgi:hypothetical protein
MDPDRMRANYAHQRGRAPICGGGLYGGLTPAQRRRVRHKLRWFYGLSRADKDAWITAQRAAGRVIR